MALATDTAVMEPQPSIDTCHACGKFFPRMNVRLCRECVQVEANRFSLIRDYLSAHEGVRITDIAAGTGLPPGEVVRFQASGQLVPVKRESVTQFHAPTQQ